MKYKYKNFFIIYMAMNALGIFFMSSDVVW